MCVCVCVTAGPLQSEETESDSVTRAKEGKKKCPKKKNLVPAGPGTVQEAKSKSPKASVPVWSENISGFLKGIFLLLLWFFPLFRTGLAPVSPRGRDHPDHPDQDWNGPVFNA